MFTCTLIYQTQVISIIEVHTAKEFNPTAILHLLPFASLYPLLPVIHDLDLFLWVKALRESTPELERKINTTQQFFTSRIIRQKRSPRPRRRTPGSADSWIPRLLLAEHTQASAGCIASPARPISRYHTPVSSEHSSSYTPSSSYWSRASNRRGGAADPSTEKTRWREVARARPPEHRRRRRRCCFWWRRCWFSPPRTRTLRRRRAVSGRLMAPFRCLTVAAMARATRAVSATATLTWGRRGFGLHPERLRQEWSWGQ